MFSCLIRAHVNIFCGFAIVFWIITPILYYTNTWDAQKMPIVSNLVFDQDGSFYDPTKLLGENWRLNRTAHQIYGKISFIVDNFSYFMRFMQVRR